MKYYTSEDCMELGCQCEKCQNITINCCIGREIACPDNPRFDPEYVCPDFTPREEEEDNAAN